MKGTNNDLLYFRGDLKVTVISATNLPNADGSNIKAKFDKLLSRNKNKKKDLSGRGVTMVVNYHGC